MPKPAQRDPGLIDEASLTLPVGAEEDDSQFYREMASSLADQLESARAELTALKARKTIDDVRAGMLEAYSNKVFLFVAVYCAIVGLFLSLSGWRQLSGFTLSDTILAIIAGSTAVAVIGLIGMVITGLFGSTARARAKVADKKAAD